VQVKSRVYFGVRSVELSPEELQARIGAEPSRLRRMASKSVEPLRPTTNGWMLDSGLADSEPLWRHLQAVFVRLAPLVEALAQVCAGEPRGSLVVVREYHFSERESDVGFWLEPGWVSVLHRIGASLDVDEYDYISSEDEDEA
jgi:hypothetical protein